MHTWSAERERTLQRIIKPEAQFVLEEGKLSDWADEGAIELSRKKARGSKRSRKKLPKRRHLARRSRRYRGQPTQQGAEVPSDGAAPGAGAAAGAAGLGRPSEELAPAGSPRPLPSKHDPRLPSPYAQDGTAGDAPAPQRLPPPTVATGPTLRAGDMVKANRDLSNGSITSGQRGVVLESGPRGSAKVDIGLSRVGWHRPTDVTLVVRSSEWGAASRAAAQPPYRDIRLQGSGESTAGAASSCGSGDRPVCTPEERYVCSCAPGRHGPFAFGGSDPSPRCQACYGRYDTMRIPEVADRWWLFVLALLWRAMNRVPRPEEEAERPSQVYWLQSPDRQRSLGHRAARHRVPQQFMIGDAADNLEALMEVDWSALPPQLAAPGLGSSLGHSSSSADSATTAKENIP